MQIPSGTFRIDPDGVMPLEGLANALEVKTCKLLREVRAGRLRAVERCGRMFITGEAALAWLTGSEEEATTADETAVANAG